MYQSELRSRIAQEQREKIIAAAESAAVTLFGVVSAAILPQLLLNFFIKDGQFMEPPMWYQYIPHAGYGLAALFFVVFLIGNFMRSRRIKFFQQELQMMAYMCEDCCDENCEECRLENEEADMTEEVTVDELAQAMKASKSSKTKTAKVSKTKKPTAKKTKKTTK